uniref:Uncharacterized protein n=1 Tax=Arundo donax TaxID=35708 RepID=A0A0A8YJ63_ARUDO
MIKREQAKKDERMNVVGCSAARSDSGRSIDQEFRTIRRRGGGSGP